MPDGSLMTSFTQAEGPVEGRPRAPAEVQRRLVWPPEGRPGYDMTGLTLHNVHLRSADQGRTWTHVSADPFQTCMNGVTGEAETALGDGTIVRTVWGFYLPYDPGVPQTGLLQRSRDGSRTWGPFEPVLPPDRFTAWPKRIRVLRDGRILATGGLARVPAGGRTRTELSRLFEPLLLVSSDQGKTWKGPIPVVAESQRSGWGGEEYDAAELPDGGLLCMFRRPDPRDPSHEVRWQAVLRKAGDTWAASEARPSPFPHSGHPELLATREGPILHLATSGIHWTDDAGATWHRFDLPGTGYYPRSVQDADGRIFVFAHVGGDDAYGRVDQSIVMDSFRLACSSPPPNNGAIELRNEVCRYEVSTDGRNRALVGLADNVDHCEPGQPFMVLGRGAKTWPSSQRRAAGRCAHGLVRRLRRAGQGTRRDPSALFHALDRRLLGGEADWLQFCNLRVKMTRNVGNLVNAAWDDHFAVCVLACNDRTDGGSHGVPTARAYREFGIEGAKVAIVAVPTGGPDPASKLLDAIEIVELEQGLPHPTIERRLDQARARAVQLVPHGRRHQLQERRPGDRVRQGRFRLRGADLVAVDAHLRARSAAQFPGGLAGLKEVADKIHAAGMQVGLHVMQGMVGWGPKDDPYLRPKADPRLLQDRHATLAAPLDAEGDARSRVTESTADWPETRATSTSKARSSTTPSAPPAVSPIASAGCTGRRSSRIRRRHARRAPRQLLPDLGLHCVQPRRPHEMIDEICDRIARVFNAIGADMSYFDGGEEMLVQPPHWRNQGRFALGVQPRLKKPVIIEGNALYTHLSWHVISRGSPDFDPIYFGRRAYTLRFKGQNPAEWANNLLTGDVGWFAPTPTRRPPTP